MEKTHLNFLSFSLILATAVFIAIGQICWKLAAERAGEAITLTAASVGIVILSSWFLIGGLAYVAGVGLWMLQLSRLPLATAFAATTGLVFLATLAADVFLFGSALALSRILGGVLVIIGIILSVT